MEVINWMMREGSRFLVQAVFCFDTNGRPGILKSRDKVLYSVFTCRFLTSFLSNVVLENGIVPYILKSHAILIQKKWPYIFFINACLWVCKRLTNFLSK